VKPFDIDTLPDLAKLLLIPPQELEEVSFKRGKYYRVQRIPKANGTFRTLLVPQGKLKLLQQKIDRHILRKFALRDCVHGAVVGRSVLTNAKAHVGKAIVFSIDIKDFFPSVCPTMVRAIFEALGFRGEAVNQLVKATTFNGQLPQGAPSSSSLANISMTRVDVRLEGLASKNGFAYTRYIDDLTFSGPDRLKKFRRLIRRIVEEEGFSVNSDKIVTMHAGMRQVVTKLIVNQKINLPREEREKIRKSALQAMDESDSNNPTLNGRIVWLSSVNPQLGSKIQNLISH
jgi:RNA-directed DNA polymerase